MSAANGEPASSAPTSGRRLSRQAAIAAVVLLVVVVAVVVALPQAASRPKGPPAPGTTHAAPGAAGTLHRGPSPPSAKPAPTTVTGVQLSVAEQAVLPWTDRFGVLHVEVVVAVRNSGGGPVAIVPESVSYTIDDGAGRGAVVGRFPVAIPSVFAAHRLGWLVDSISTGLSTQAELKRLRVNVGGQPAATPDRLLRVGQLAWSSAPDASTASGEVTNVSGTVAGTVAVLVVARSADRRLLGAVYDVADVSRLGPGQRAAFTTGYPGAPPLPPGRVAVTEGIATAPSP